MKPYSLIFSILLLTAQQALAQDYPLTRKLTYKIFIADSIMNQTKGYLYNITDTTILVSPWSVRFVNSPALNEYKEFSYSKIAEITVKRTHGPGRGAWKGAIVGFLIGAAAGFIEGDDRYESYLYFTAGSKAIIYGGLTAGVGTGVGALIGALVKKKFIIGGRKENFDAMKMNILNRTYGGSPANSQ